jgi:alanine racemase
MSSMISLDDLLESASSLGVHVAGEVFARNFAAIAYDSRTLRPGDLFVAVRTERADGHDFVEAACMRGASAVLVERDIDTSAHGVTCIVVRDTREALIHWARFVLARQSPEVIAVSGGVGKTSTEEALVRILSAEGEDESVFTNGNMNDLFGLPVALGGLAVSHSVAVLELASDRPGEMAELVAIAKPRGAVITNIAPVHSDSLGPIERMAGEQLALVQAIPPQGWLALNADDRRLRGFAEASVAPVLLYGFAPESDVRALEVQAGPEGLELSLGFRGTKEHVQTRLLGFHNAYTLLAAAAAALSHGIPLSEIAARLSDFKPLPGRLRPLRGIEGITLLDDSQSASPRSLAAALETLALFPERRIAVLGDIPDLDSAGDGADEAIAAQLAGSADLLVTLGASAEQLGEAAGVWGLTDDRIVAVNAPDDVAAALGTRVRPGDTVLVKGAESARMERVVERLLEDRGEATGVLVRQDPGWRQRIFLPRERPTWIEVDLGAIASNIEHACRLAGPPNELMIVLKADAYGHGAVLVARTALLHGATMGAVACLSEGVALREAGIRAPILLLGYVPPWQARDIVRHRLSSTVFSLELAARLSMAAQAAKAEPVPVHVKVDTGMSRLGIAPQDLRSFVAELRRLPGITVEGIFTHFATADEGADAPLAQAQLRLFAEAVSEIQASGPPVRYIHAANSAALINGLGKAFNLARVGILAYGLDPSDKTRCPPEFKPALSFKTRVAQVRKLPAGACVSYGCAFVTQRPSVIAVIPVGYGDGFRRSPRDWGEVLVRGKRAPIAGNVCMDMAMIDVTDIDGVKEGDEVVLIGRQGQEEITADDVAHRLGTINYEVVTQILPRVPRTVP